MTRRAPRALAANAQSPARGGTSNKLLALGWRLGLLAACLANPQPSRAQTPAAANSSAPGTVGDKALAKTQALLAGYRACGNVEADKPCAALDALFDFATLTQAPMVGHKSRLSAGQQKRFDTAFGRVIRVAARRSGHDLTVGQPALNFLGQAAGRAKVDVHVSRPEDDVDAHVAFVWRTNGPSWQIVDVELDGASMVQDYHNQFGRVLKKDGPEALVAKVEARGGTAQKKAK